MVEPRHDLELIFSLVTRKAVWFSAKSKSVYAVQSVFRGTIGAKSQEQAEDFILTAILTLTKAHFWKSVIQWNDPGCVADVYGLIYDNKPWFIKFMPDEESGEKFLDEISFHPPEEAFETSGGIKIPKGVQ